MKKLLSIFALLLSIVSFVSPAASETKIALSKITSIDISKDIAYIATLDGRIYYDGKTLDISDRIKFAGNWGLMTVRANPSGTYLYVYYTAKTTVTSGELLRVSVVSRFPITLAGLGPEQVVFDQVYSPSAIHAGGGLRSKPMRCCLYRPATWLSQIKTFGLRARNQSIRITARCYGWMRPPVSRCQIINSPCSLARRPLTFRQLDCAVRFE